MIKELFMSSPVSLDTIISLCKRRGFVYQSAEIYGGLNGVYDFGPLGALLNQNIRAVWRTSLENPKGEIVDLEGSLLGPRSVWEASGHISNFNDPMVDCLNCKHRYRADDIDLNKACPHCGQQKWSEVRQFNLMFKTYLGAMVDNASEAYLRPETAQTIFVNFKNVTSTTRVKVPFGIAQIGKAFRNEITPKQFLFRVREFEQMEMEWFCYAKDASEAFDFWRQKRMDFYAEIGISKDNVRFHDHGKDELAHYSVACTDVEYQFPFGWKELEGIAHRGNFDLSQHSKFSGKDLAVYDEETKTSELLTVVESSVGVGRLFLALFCDAYREDEVEGETRVVLKFHPRIAPIKAAFFPLSKKLSEPMEALFKAVKKETGYMLQFDESGSIGKRYRRQDEIGTPLCFTYDFESETDKCVTVRHRDSTKQERISIDQVVAYMRQHIG
jgi:glycyl-tRNA synthetase